MRSPFEAGNPNPPSVGPYPVLGTVVNRDDNLGRVRVRVPGLCEPQSAWALPMGTVGGGSANRGFFAVPELGAQVFVFFLEGDIERPCFMCGPWSEDAPPSVSGGDPDVREFATETFRIVLSESEEGRVCSIANLKTGDGVTMNADTNSMTIKSTTLLRIEALGRVEIDAAEVRVGGRLVRPIEDPI